MWPFSRTPQSPVQIKGISVREVRTRVKAGATLLDVRTPREFQALHPAGAINVPPDRIKRDDVGLPRDAEILVICLQGRRSKKAARQLVQLGYTDVTDVFGGMEHWVKFGLPVKRTRKAK